MSRRPYSRWKYAGKKVDPFYRSRAWKKIRIHVLLRDEGLCQICRRRFANTVHHILPRADYPEKELDPMNLQAACAICHNQEHPEKGRKDQEDTGPDLSGIRVIKI